MSDFIIEVDTEVESGRPVLLRVDPTVLAERMRAVRRRISRRMRRTHTPHLRLRRHSGLVIRIDDDKLPDLPISIDRNQSIDDELPDLTPGSAAVCPIVIGEDEYETFQDKLDNDYQLLTCSVCMDDLARVNTVPVCKEKDHVLCKPCMDKWLKSPPVNSHMCPQCRDDSVLSRIPGLKEVWWNQDGREELLNVEFGDPEQEQEPEEDVIIIE